MKCFNQNEEKYSHFEGHGELIQNPCLLSSQLSQVIDRQLNQIFTNGDNLRCLTITLIMEKARADMPQIAVPINGLRIDFQSIFDTGYSFSETLI